MIRNLNSTEPVQWVKHEDSHEDFTLRLYAFGYPRPEVAFEVTGCNSVFSNHSCSFVQVSFECLPSFRSNKPPSSSPYFHAHQATSIRTNSCEPPKSLSDQLSTFLLSISMLKTSTVKRKLGCGCAWVKMCRKFNCKRKSPRERKKLC
jgi:hypothetical protein